MDCTQTSDVESLECPEMVISTPVCDADARHEFSASEENESAQSENSILGAPELDHIAAQRQSETHNCTTVDATELRELSNEAVKEPQIGKINVNVEKSKKQKEDFPPGTEKKLNGKAIDPVDNFF